jgi:ATP-dependent helicase/nuclease subunit B
VYNSKFIARYAQMAFQRRSRYNPEMGTRVEEEIDGWLRRGGLVVTSSDRAARALQRSHHRLRRAEGLSAWPTPKIVDWRAFARSAWEDGSVDGRVLMNSSQEQGLWTEIIRDERQLPTALNASIHRLAELAMEAHELLCFYSPGNLRTAARSRWDRDAGAFSQWLASFDEACRKNNLVSASRIPRESIARLQANVSSRPLLLAAGFDRVLPVQREIFDAWGQWHLLANEDNAAQRSFHAAFDSQSELEACAFWCNREIAAKPESRLLVITQDIALRRGEIERAFLRFSNHIPNFEFSLGIPLAQVPVARAGFLLLRWLQGAVDEDELDWLISSRLTADQEESAALEVYMRVLRRKGLQRTQWTLQAFLDRSAVSAELPQFWVRRMVAAQRLLRDSGGKVRNPIEWADFVPRLLETTGWPGERSQESADFQAMLRWQQALDTAGSLGFDGRRSAWPEFLAEFDRALKETLFAPESVNAPIQIVGPAESAGLTADGIWFLSADEGSWPAVGSLHPLLPPAVQSEADMPHASALRDWELSSAITKRLVNSAPVIHFSFATQTQDGDARPSRLITRLAGPPLQLPAEMTPPSTASVVAASYSDSSKVPFRLDTVRGGSGILTSQSQCPFKAFAVARLGAKDWDTAEVGLTPAQRGQILHSILRSIWSGAPDGLRSLDELRGLDDRAAFVERHVKRRLQEEVASAVLDQMPRRYLDVEEMRLKHIVTEWLAYEARRVAFSVEGTEVERTLHLAGLTLKVRMDRMDRLSDGSLLVIDYKTGDISPRVWELPRPDDVQLPLYAGFALDEGPGGLVFAKLRAYDWEFVGNVADARKTLQSDIPARSPLVRDPLTPEKMKAWKANIEELARDFIAGRSDASPRDYPKTCERCGLQTICRIQEPENQSRLTAKGDGSGEEAADE